MFIDEAVITVKTGKGGNGASSFRREKSVQFGGPDGGDGGNGGGIVFQADNNLNTLVDFKYRKVFRADDGENGKKKKMHGKTGEDLVIKVPVGTMIRDFETNVLLMDINKEGEKRVFLEGGNGGHGNPHFKSSIQKAPRRASKGQKEKEVKIKMELKLLADVALVGFPNVGKSTLISKVSASKSKIGNYHFTTINPKLGVVRIGDEKSFVIADVPGLVEGAHEGRGLGDKFLRHIERCKLIFHLVDVSGSEGREPLEDFKKINHELKSYSEKLFSKRQIVLANKMDIMYNEENFKNLKEYLDKEGIEVHPVSVILGDGIKEILNETYNVIQEIDRETLEEELEVVEMLKERRSREPDWVISQDEDEVYEVEGRAVDEVLDKYIFSNDESVIDFIHILKKKGLENKLRNCGVVDGDVIRVAGLEFDFVE